MHQRPLGRDREAVSPLIATILLIAITVAVAAIVLTISQNLANESVSDPPPRTAFQIRDHNDPLAQHTCESIFTITVGERIQMRDFSLRVNDGTGWLDIWGRNETMTGNLNDTLELWYDGFQDNDYPLDPTSTENRAAGDDVLDGGESLVLREIRHPGCGYFGPFTTLQVRLVYTTGDILLDTELNLA